MNREVTFLFLLALWTRGDFFNAEDLLSEIPATTQQKQHLAHFVCIDLVEDESYSNVDPKVQADRMECEKNFLSHNRIPVKPPTVTLKQRTADQVSVTVAPPSDHVQIVALVNEHNSNEIIYYSLIKNNEPPDPLFPDSKESYVFWTAALNSNGTRSVWKQGPLLVSWKQLQGDSSQNDDGNKLYNINYVFLMDEYKNDSYYISGKFWWNSSDPTDVNFQVINNCYKEIQGNLYDRDIRPDSNRTVILQLPINDTCTIRVKGKYTMTNYTYHTPDCEDVPKCEPSPAIPVNVSTEVSQEDDPVADEWSVRVRWATPRRAPADYNVTLRARDAHTKIVAGNATEVEFVKVKGDGLYNVSVVARSPGKPPAVATRRNMFPVAARAARWSGLAAGAAGAAALLWLGALLLCALVVRGRLAANASAKIYFPGVLEKIPEDADTDTSGAESGSEDHWEVHPDRLQIHEVIGEGAFGVVRRGTLAPTDKNVAVKMLKDFPSVEEFRSFRAEMELMKSVGAHPHVVSLLGCCSGRRPLIVVEYCSRGDLLSYLRCSWDLMLSRRNAKYYNDIKEGPEYRNDLFKNKPDAKFAANRLYELQGVCDAELTLLDLLSFCRQIAMGMEFLASNHVVHRDLAARNVLVTADRTLKIADFGLSRDVYQENQYQQKSNGKMPVKWMALESLTHRIYTTQTDVWSFGVVMWEVVTMGGAPYAGVSAARLPRLLAAGYRMPQPHNCSAQLYRLMLSCWLERPRSRPTFSELHCALDALLCASADHYISLSLPALAPADDAGDVPLSRYVRNLIRGKWRNGKLYERTFVAPSNHYTAQPAPLIQT